MDIWYLPYTATYPSINTDTNTPLATKIECKKLKKERRAGKQKKRRYHFAI
jgi:hypothetical protein